MALKLTNNAVSTLAAGITTSATSISVQSSDAGKFPSLAVGDWFPVTVVDESGNIEFMKCTARAGAVLTVVRAQESSTAYAFSSGARVVLRLTAAAIAAFMQTEAAILAFAAINHGHEIDAINGLQTALDNLTNGKANLSSGVLADGELPARLRSPGTNATNANACTAPGWYTLKSDATNIPLVQDGAMLVLQAQNGDTIDAENIVQIWLQRGADKIYLRRRSAGTFAGWKLVLTESDGQDQAIWDAAVNENERPISSVKLKAAVKQHEAKQSGVPDAVLYHKQPSGTSITGTSGSWQTYPLNTEDDPNAVVLLTANQFTFTKDGWVDWCAHFHRTNAAQTRLYNVTTAAVVGEYGMATYSETDVSASPSVPSQGGAKVVANNIYVLQYRITVADPGSIGKAAGFGSEIYGWVKFFSKHQS